MRYYCTLTDYAYLPRALVLYESLLKHSSEEFRLYVLPMDRECERALVSLALNEVRISGRALHMRHWQLRERRTHQEYCWTCASLFTEDTMEFLEKETVYLDADLMFFSDPKQVFDEIGARSIGIIPHRFIPEKQYLAVNGQFNVSWVSFKNTPVGQECLSTWARQVREKCSATDGCGDQKYLDEWPSKYGDEVCIIQNAGAGLAPWNLANYRIESSLDGVMVLNDRVKSRTAEWDDLIFYHYHEFDFEARRLTNYQLRTEDIELIYKPYLAAYRKAKATIESLRIQIG